MKVKIIKIDKNRWKEFRDLRLFALKTEKFSFLTTYEEDNKNKSSDWKRKMDTTIFAEVNGKLVGMAAYFFATKKRVRHIADILAVYVLPEFRGEGIAQKLFDYIIKECKKNKIKKIELEVFENNLSAKKFYLKNGFKVVGKLKNEFLVDGKYYDEIMMEKFI